MISITSTSNNTRATALRSMRLAHLKTRCPLWRPRLMKSWPLPLCPTSCNRVRSVQQTKETRVWVAWTGFYWWTLVSSLWWRTLFAEDCKGPVTKELSFFKVNCHVWSIIKMRTGDTARGNNTGKSFCFLFFLVSILKFKLEFGENRQNHVNKVNIK